MVVDVIVAIFVVVFVDVVVGIVVGVIGAVVVAFSVFKVVVFSVNVVANVVNLDVVVGLGSACV